MSGAMPIGGYFGLSLDASVCGPPWLPGAVGFQSARAAIAAVFHSNRARAVWVPHFICGAVRDALAYAGTPVRGYALDTRFGVPEHVELENGEWLLCVDYFGLSGAACDDAIKRFGPHRIVVDASQALLHAPRPGVATVYSPRKFCGVPDGGLLVNAPYVGSPVATDEMASIERAKSLLLRTAGQVAAGYEAFQANEVSLTDCSPQTMSTLTLALLSSVDVSRVSDRRIANYTHLTEMLGRQASRLDSGCVPLCCPVPFPNAEPARKALAARGIYTPGYWPDALVPVDDTVGRALRHDTLYLPCDQRYDAGDMARIVDTLSDIGGIG